jgi:hypothetical protein
MEKLRENRKGETTESDGMAKLPDTNVREVIGAAVGQSPLSWSGLMTSAQSAKNPAESA